MLPNPFDVGVAKMGGAQPQSDATQPNPFDDAANKLKGQLPSTKPLPNLALGFTPKGEPYYGEGFNGWARRVVGTLTDPTITSEGLTQQQKDANKAAAQTWANQFKAANPGVTNMTDYLASWDEQYQNVRTQLANGDMGGFVSSEAKLLGKSLGTFIGQGIMPIFSLPEQGVRKVIAAGQVVDELGGTTMKTPRPTDNRWLQSLEGFSNVANYFNMAQSAQALLKYGKGQFGEGDWGAGVTAYAMAPLALLGGPIGAAVAKGITGGVEAATNLPGQDQTDNRIVQRNIIGSRMVYSGLFSALTKQEMVRQLEAGVPMTNVAEQLTKPGVELAWSLMLDPLNFVGGVWGKAKYVDDMENAAKASSIVTNPEVARLAQEIGTSLTDTTAASGMSKIFDILNKSDFIDVAGKKISAAVVDYRPTSLTSTAKAASASEVVNGFLAPVIATYKDNPQDAAEVMAQLVKFATANTNEERNAASAYLLRSKVGQTVFTDSGMTTGALFKKILGEDKPEHFVDLVRANGKTTKDLVEFLGKRLDGALDELFPTINKMKKTDPAAYAKLAAEKPWVVRVNSLVGDETAIGKMYTSANRMFSTIYFNTFGFVSRNALTNTFHIMADEGPVAAGKALVEAGGNFFSGGKWSGRNRAFMDAMYGEGNWEKVVGNVTLDKEIEAGWKAIMKLNGNVESAMRTSIARNAVERELTNAIHNGVLPDLESLSGLGFTKEEVQVLNAGILRSLGDTKKVRQIMLNNSAAGEIRSIMLQVPPESLTEFFGKASLGDEFRALQETTDLADFQAKRKALVDGITQLAKSATGEIGGPAINSPEEWNLAASMVDLGKMTTGVLTKAELDKVPALFSQAITTHQEAVRVLFDAVQEQIHILKQGDQFSARLAADLGETMVGLQGSANVDGKAVPAALNALRDRVFMVRDELRAAKTPAEATAAIEKYKESVIFMNPLTGKAEKFAEVRTGGGRNDFLNQLFDFFRERSNETYRQLDDKNLTAIQQALVTAVGPVQAETRLAEAKSLFSQSREIFDRVTDYRSSTNIPVEDYINSLLNSAESNSATMNLEQLGWKRGKDALLKAVNQDITPEAQGKSLVSMLWDSGVSNKERRSYTKFGLGTYMTDLPPEGTVDLTKLTNMLAKDKVSQVEIGGKKYTFLSQAGANGEGILVEGAKGEQISMDTRNITKAWSPAGKEVWSRKVNPAAPGVLHNFQKPLEVTDNSRAYKLGQEAYQAALDAGKKEGSARRAMAQAITDFAKRNGYDAIIRPLPGGQRGVIALGDTAVKQYKDLSEVPIQEAINAIQSRTGSSGIDDLFKRVFVSGDKQHSIGGAFNENLVGFQRHFGAWADAIEKNWETAFTPSHMSPEKIQALDKVLATVDNRMAQAKQFALQVGKEEANFALHSYSSDKTYLDRGLAFIMPYHYWYTRTYTKWMSRLIYDPQLVAAYAKYRHNLEIAHAGMPDWWKYNINSNDLPGIDTKNPMYFNLESTLNPVNGLTGVDFNDANKRVDWLSRTVDDLGKFGPNIWTPIQWLVAASLYAKGENDAAQRWVGRLVPQTAVLKTVLNHFGVQGPSLGSYGTYNEYDPLVSLFNGGFDPYERRRIGRALYGLAADGQITPEQAYDAAYTQQGDVWRMGVERSADERWLGTVGSFFAGVGFKNRTASDMQIDNFYNDFFGLMNQKSSMTPDGFRNAMNDMEQRYPFMDTVLLSRKSEDERNATYAYNVLARIPPGQSTRMFDAVGINSDMVSRFYDQKGDFTGWASGDLTKFMSGVTDLGAIMALPDAATRDAYTNARNLYDGMNGLLKGNFGEDILDKMDTYYSMDDQQKKFFLAEHPELQQAFNTKDQIISQSPQLYEYYGSISRIQRMYQSQMYTYLQQKYGADITDKWNEYYRLTEQDAANKGKSASLYKKAHPEMAAYSKDKAAWDSEITRKLAQFAAYMPEQPTVPLRSDLPQTLSQGQQAAVTAATPQQGPSWQDWQSVLNDSEQRLILAYFTNGTQLPSAISSQLDYDAKKYGYNSGDEMLQAIGQSIYQQSPQASYGP